MIGTSLVDLLSDRGKPLARSRIHHPNPDFGYAPAKEETEFGIRK